jgi:hypothetical protein
MAEIGCSKSVWEAKINLCWWHLRRAVRTCLAKAKLSTTPYNFERASNEYGFIEADFIPPGTRVDIEDYEGGSPDLTHLVDAAASAAAIQPSTNPKPVITQPQPPSLGNGTNLLRIRLPLASVVAAIPSTSHPQNPPACDGYTSNKENLVAAHPPQCDRVIQGIGFTLRVAGPTTVCPEQATVGKNAAGEDEANVSEGEDDGARSRRTFCPPLYRDPIVKMMERHYCAHPLIPGYAPPDPIGIKHWAVQQIYNFCVKHELPEVWVYLWENWYRKGRWELWARCTHDLIPRLKTTMILESQ